MMLKTAQREITWLISRAARHVREVRLARKQRLPDPQNWAMQPVAGVPGQAVFDQSSACREADFRTPWFSYWASRIGAKLVYHRKLWEFVFVCQALHERDMLGPGRRGLGFGVGGEALPALFASVGCEIVATDLSHSDAAVIGWTQTAEHASGLDDLRRPSICMDELFDQRVRFREVDMNAVPEDLIDFDFCWSACALEHLGSIAKGWAFVERSLECLKPGGYAVHTTEFNVSSNKDTLDNFVTVLFRQRDFEDLKARLEAAGHTVAPFDFSPGMGVLDGYVDLPPYLNEPHLKLAMRGYATTSFGIIVRKAD